MSRALDSTVEPGQSSSQARQTPQAMKVPIEDILTFAWFDTSGEARPVSELPCQAVIEKLRGTFNRMFYDPNDDSKFPQSQKKAWCLRRKSGGRDWTVDNVGLQCGLCSQKRLPCLQRSRAKPHWTLCPRDPKDRLDADVTQSEYWM